MIVQGALKNRARAEEKIAADYAEEGAAPAAAASQLVDIVRASVILDDPYAIAVLVLGGSAKPN